MPLACLCRCRLFNPPPSYYQQLWDWDSMITGAALLELGSAPYLAGSMKNFLSGVDLSTGMVKGCLTPDGATPTIYHAKPVLIQGTWIGAKHSKGHEETARGKSSHLLSPPARDRRKQPEAKAAVS